MGQCAVHQCEMEGAETFDILGRKKVLSKGHQVEVTTRICAEHNAAVAAGAMCVYTDEPATVWLTDSHESDAPS